MEGLAPREEDERQGVQSCDRKEGASGHHKYQNVLLNMGNRENYFFNFPKTITYDGEVEDSDHGNHDDDDVNE